MYLHHLRLWIIHLNTYRLYAEVRMYLVFAYLHFHWDINMLRIEQNTYTHTLCQLSASEGGLAKGAWTNWYSPTVFRASPRNLTLQCCWQGTFHHCCKLKIGSKAREGCVKGGEWGSQRMCVTRMLRQSFPLCFYLFIIHSGPCFSHHLWIPFLPFLFAWSSFSQVVDT